MRRITLNPNMSGDVTVAKVRPIDFMQLRPQVKAGDALSGEDRGRLQPEEYVGSLLM
jgi:hypothetical protein